MDECNKKLQRYCYVCGKFVISQSLINITATAERAYKEYFGMTIIRNVPWVPHKMCRTCYNRLMSWSQGRHKAMDFGVPTVWTAPSK